MNTTRLLKLAAHLDILHATPRAEKPRLFDLSEWQNSCGTAACAGGEACYIPEFQAAGLRMTRSGGGAYRPTFNDQTGWEAMEAFFDIPMETAEYIFSPFSYMAGRATPEQVADRIRFVVQNGR